MEYRPLDFSTLEPILHDGPRLRFQIGNLPFRPARYTDERDNPLDDKIFALCQTFSSSELIAHDQITIHSSSDISPFFSLRGTDSSEDVRQRTLQIKANLASPNCVGLYILFQHVRSRQHAAGELAGLISHSQIIYPVIRNMFGKLGIPPKGTAFVKPILIQKVGPVNGRLPHRPNTHPSPIRRFKSDA